jgi:hypothetical protein
MHRNDFIVRRSCPQGRRAPQSRSVHARLGQRELARAPGFARNVGSSPRQRLSVWTRPLFAFEAPPTSIQAKLQATALRDPSGRAPGRSGGQSKVRQFCRGGDAAEFGFLGPEALAPGQFRSRAPTAAAEGRPHVDGRRRAATNQAQRRQPARCSRHSRPVVVSQHPLWIGWGPEKTPRGFSLVEMSRTEERRLSEHTRILPISSSRM